MTPKVTISILAHNKLELTRKCFESVEKNTECAQILLTNNASTDGTAEFFQSLHQRRFGNGLYSIYSERNKANLGFIEANRIAFNKCKNDWFVFLNNDTEVPPRWIEKMLAEFEKHPAAAIVGAKDSPHSIGENLGGFVGDHLEYIEFSCAMIKTEVFRKIGLFSPGLIGAYCEDQDCALRVRELGYTIHEADFTIKHERHATSRHVPEVRGWIENNSRYFHKRWAHYMKVRRFDYPTVIHSASAAATPLLTPPVLKAMKAARPLSPIYLEVDTPDLFTANGVIEKAAKSIPAMPGELRINLDDQPTQTTRNGRSLLPGDRIERKDTPPTVTLLYVYPLGTVEWQKMAYDFVESYVNNPPDYDHDTLIVCNGCPVDQRARNLFARLPRVRFMTHDNEGQDIGAYLAGARKATCDMLVLFGSNSYLTKSGWMRRFVEAWQAHGPGLYGAFGSFEIIPHLCTTMLAVAPELLRRNPEQIRTKAERYDWEHGDGAFWRMVHASEHPVRLVTFDGEYEWPYWRLPPNIYRRGDQSNCLGGFRITREFEKQNEQWKTVMSSYADTLSDRNFQP